MSEELAVADIQQAFFEYRAVFKEPVAGFWYGGRQGELITALLKALAAWGLGLDNVSWNQAAKNVAEVQLTFAIPALFASIQTGVAGVSMTAFDPSWERQPMLQPLFQAAAVALKTCIGQEFQFQQTTFGFHVKPGAKPFREIVTQFVNPKTLGADDAAMFGVSAYYKEHSFVIDNSAVVAGGVFVKLIRTFGPTASFEEMGKARFSDETAVLGRLGLKIK